MDIGSRSGAPIRSDPIAARPHHTDLTVLPLFAAATAAAAGAQLNRRDTKNAPVSAQMPIGAETIRARSRAPRKTTRAAVANLIRSET